MMTPDEAIAIVHEKARGRTGYEGQEPRLDEVLVAEIERLRAEIKDLVAFVRDLDANDIGSKELRAKVLGPISDDWCYLPWWLYDNMRAIVERHAALATATEERP